MNSQLPHIIYTVVLFFAFIGMVFWAYSRKRRKDFDQAANLPFADEQQHESSALADDEQHRRDQS